MASKNTSSNSRQAVQRSNSDSARWIAGLLLLLVGVAADRFGLRAAMFASPFSFLCVLLITRFLQMKKHRNG